MIYKFNLFRYPVYINRASNFTLERKEKEKKRAAREEEKKKQEEIERLMNAPAMSKEDLEK